MSEAQLVALAGELARELRVGDRVVLEGEMGAGKSTFARALLRALGVAQPAEGSPSFAIAHEYQCMLGEVAHIDFYRFRSESEIEQAGIESYFWERPMVVITEWLSAFPEFSASVKRPHGASGRVWEVFLTSGNAPDSRDVEISLKSR